MLEWLKRRTTEKSTSPALSLGYTDSCLNWVLGAQGANAKHVSPAAFPILEQLESDGLVSSQAGGFSADWSDLYSILGHAEYQQVAADLQIPPIRKLAPSLGSVGTLTDADFGISIIGWTDERGIAVDATQHAGPVLRISGSNYLIPESSWHVFKRVTDFWTRAKNDRNENANRRAWGKIRIAAKAAGAQLDGFLYRSVVLTPEKLQLELSRVDFSGTKVVQVIPTFAGCPQDWLVQFDRYSSVPDRFDFSTPDGIVQVLLTPAVKAVLEQIKRMPGRRVAGSRAEAFVANPFAALGEDAVATIDPEQFEQARIAAGLVFDRFTAHIERDAMGNPIKIGLLIESPNPKTRSILNSSVVYFSDDEELEKFIDSTDARLKKDYQISAWRDYEFELLGNARLELETLSKALESRRKGFVQITVADVYDLSRYSSRVMGIGMTQPFFSPYIAKRDSSLGWFPENLVPMIKWQAQDSDQATVLPLTAELEKLIIGKTADAIKNGQTAIEVPGLPTPISIAEAKNLLETFSAARPQLQNDIATEEIAGNKRTRPQSLLIKANIEKIDYAEIQRELLSTYEKKPTLPAALRADVTLKEHQREGIAWLQNAFRLSPSSCRGVVLADDMGLGKTLQLLTFIAWAFEEDPDLAPVLIVAPVSLLENWQDEIKRFFKVNTFDVATIYGEALKALRVAKSSIDKQLLEDGLVKFLRPGWIGDTRIVLTTYETLRELEYSFAAEQWSVMVCDEAQKIKNPNALVTRAAKKQNVRFKVACTGTPVENTLADLWCLFDFVQPGILGALNEFGQRYRRPIEAKSDEQKMRVEELRGLISAQILRRTKAEVAKDLPSKIIVQDCSNIAISALQDTLYSEVLSSYQRPAEPGDSVAPKSNHLGILQKLRMICTDPKTFTAEAAPFESLATYRKHAPKLDWLLHQLLQIKGKNEKAIVFCELRGVQRLLRHYINEVFEFSPDVINGDVATSATHEHSRQKRLKVFQEKPGFGVIILSPIAVGFGVNIQAANHVIHFTRMWNPAKEDQATDRAYRIGQTKDVYVYCPLVAAANFNTFDITLHKLLENKRELATDMLNGANDIGVDEFFECLG